MIDVAVIGGGPAGLAAAILARQRNLSVRVFEPRPGIIDKACGEGLMPPARKMLADLGVAEPPGMPFRGIRYIDRGHAVEAAFSKGPGLGVRRTELHKALRTRAEALGIEIVEHRVTEWEHDEEGVTVSGQRYRWMVAADGLQSPIRRKLALDVSPRFPPRLGVRRHFRVAPWADVVEVHWSEHAEAYVTPVSADEVGVAILYNADADAPVSGDPFARWLSAFPELEERLGAPCSDVRGAGPFERRSRVPQVGRILLVGDASGYLDPLTGEGIRLGLDTALAAIDAIERGEPDRYRRSWARVTRTYWWLTGGLLWVRHRPWLRRRLVRWLKRWPRGFRLAIDALNWA